MASFRLIKEFQAKCSYDQRLLENKHPYIRNSDIEKNFAGPEDFNISEFYCILSEIIIVRLQAKKKCLVWQAVVTLGQGHAHGTGEDHIDPGWWVGSVV